MIPKNKIYATGEEVYINDLVHPKPVGPETMESVIVDVVDKMKKLLIEKNHDYGNSAEIIYNEYGDTATMIRLTDKFLRLQQLFNTKECRVKTESFEDTVRDMAGYCLLRLVFAEKEKANDK